MASFLQEFEWDPLKALGNRRKHGVTFEQAVQVFRDPLALTISDDVHSFDEPRWITMGRDARGNYVVVMHTYKQTAKGSARIRIISARKPILTEIRDYEEQA